MKKVLIEQCGEETVRHYRRFYVEVPDTMDMKEFGDYDVCALVEELADEDGVDWECYESDGIFAAECSVIEPDSDAESSGEFPVLRITPEGLDAAKNRQWVPVESQARYVLQDQPGDVIATGTKNEVLSQLCDQVPDGPYRIIGLEGVWHFVRQNGVVEPDWDVLTLGGNLDEFGVELH